ncbi:tripartite tricarboxylate transporter substrate binding protein [Hydrogenophaga sp.]|uniref:Bug family tripartite tricarboxylate transporter substrate binding protein n=1 Tax=Hydrogenophaga sp. TaxID=1904254 RepID=UPI00271E8CA1|nr:tripartite tricarboxylate transporter substrate binding protein [Hydrogenophaga sp.]MDO9438067.1 tripartite tricarboxylate transporter substrate binding protein [Hydrogenophaga sp.]
MRFQLTRFVRVASLCLALATAPAVWAAGETVTLVTPLAAGSASDVALRIVTEKLAAALAQPIVIENQTGASGAIGAEKVARATPDGLTLCGCNNAILGVLPHLRKVNFDPAKSFKPVGMVAVLPTALVVNPSLPVNNVQELIAYVKANPGKVSYATGGVGSAQHIAMSMLEAATGMKMLHVPYKGASPAAVGVAAGEVHVMFNAIGTVLPFVKAGKLRAIAVAGAQRTPVMADIPTVAEQGVPGYDYASWIGIVAPAATPDDVVNRIAGELTKVLRNPDTVKRLADNGIDPSVMTPAQMREYMANDHARMAKVVADAGMKE